ncbi:MAG: aldo/keto reductase [Desulfovibrio sp.]|jgi:predicted aldo/keto reductase-like oxidoreductase|nr:aldo/keto reductase [Desulfovibrio sp.]
MEKRHIARFGLDVSLLGFGAMRLPLLAGSKTAIDQGQAEAMLDRAIAAGVNYFDTAYTYHNGISELFLGKILRNYPRNSFFLADKLPLWTLKTRDDAERIFASQLKRCRVEYFDFYLLHGLNADLYARAVRLGLYDWLYEKKEREIVRHIGFSFHDSPDVFRKILNGHAWDFAQIQLNYVDWEACGAERLYALLQERRIPAIIMEPVRGGSLADLPEKAAMLLKRSDPEASAASWAIRYAASLENVMVVLSGMSTLEQVEDNIKTMTAFSPLSDGERDILRRAASIYLSSGDIPCTACGYCSPCPRHVDISGVFAVYNHRNRGGFTQLYRAIPETAQAHNCVVCGLCLERCPQKIDIPAGLRDVTAFAGNENGA